MSLWVVRAGKYGEQEETAVKEHLVCHGWNDLPDYSACRTKDDLRTLYVRTYPRESEKRISSGLGQVWRFAHDIQKGDLVALPLKTTSEFAFGRITGEYEYKVVAPNVRHIRNVEWLKNVPRSEFPQDILFSMNSALTVFKVTRHDAEARVTEFLLRMIQLLKSQRKRRKVRLKAILRKGQLIWRTLPTIRYSNSYKRSSKVIDSPTWLVRS